MTLFRGFCAFPLTPSGGHGQVDVGAFRVQPGRLTEAGGASIGVLVSTTTCA